MYIKFLTKSQCYTHDTRAKPKVPLYDVVPILIMASFLKRSR